MMPEHMFSEQISRQILHSRSVWVAFSWTSFVEDIVSFAGAGVEEEVVISEDMLRWAWECWKCAMERKI
jgi:hypothetical protein